MVPDAAAVLGEQLPDALPQSRSAQDVVGVGRSQRTQQASGCIYYITFDKIK